MNNRIKKINEDYLNSLFGFIYEFSSKQEREFDGWCGVGEMAIYGDLWINFQDIRLDIISGAKKGEIFRWYDKGVDHALNGGDKQINYASWLAGARYPKLNNKQLIKK